MPLAIFFNLTFGLVVAVASSLVAGSVSGLVAGLVAGSVAGSVSDLAAGLAAGSAAGLAAGLDSLMLAECCRRFVARTHTCGGRWLLQLLRYHPEPRLKLLCIERTAGFRWKPRHQSWLDPEEWDRMT